MSVGNVRPLSGLMLGKFLSLGLSTAVLTSQTSFAEPISEEKLKTVKYTSSAMRFVDYDAVDVGFSIHVTCQETKEKAEALLADAYANVLALKADLLGTSATVEPTTAEFGYSDPVRDPVPNSVPNWPNPTSKSANVEDSKFEDTCKKEVLSYHEQRPFVWSGQQKVLLKAALSEADAMDAFLTALRTLAFDVPEQKLVNIANTVRKTVLDETRKKVLAEIEAETKAAAEAKEANDPNVYKSSWPSTHESIPYRSASLAEPTYTVGPNGEVEAEIKTDIPVSIAYRQVPKSGARAYERNGVETFQVPVSVKTKTGIYGELSATLTQKCAGKANIGDPNSNIEQSNNALIVRLRNAVSIDPKEKGPETDQIKLGRKFVSEDNNFREFLLDGGVAYYHPCDPQIFFTEMPQSSGFYYVVFTHQLKSSNLQDLKTLVAELKAASELSKHQNDINAVKTDYTFSHKLVEKVRENLQDELQAQAYAKLLDKNTGTFWEIAEKKCYDSACVVDEGYDRFFERDIGGGSMERSGAPEAAFSLSSADATGGGGEILPSEEGKETIAGSYTIVKKVLWELK